MNDMIEVKMTKQIKIINNKKTIGLFFESINLNLLKQWKGGRLKKRLNAHASHNRQLIHSYKNVLDFLKASWLSPVIISQRFPRGKKNELLCLVLLIDNNNKN